MKKLLIQLLIPFVCFACADSKSETPKMVITGIYLDGDEEGINYVNKFANLPPLTPGDKIDILFSLEGNDNDLRSFVVKNENTAIKTVMYFQGDEVSPDLSDLKEGKLVFVDGIYETKLTVQARIIAPLTDEQPLSFYLFSKAVDCMGATVPLAFKPNVPDKE